jgi:hypothetical protein
LKRLSPQPLTYWVYFSCGCTYLDRLEHVMLSKLARQFTKEQSYSEVEMRGLVVGIHQRIQSPFSPYYHQQQQQQQQQQQKQHDPL